MKGTRIAVHVGAKPRFALLLPALNDSIIRCCVNYNCPMPSDDPRRKPSRLAGYDYAQSAGYFVTLCSHERRNLFGQFVAGSLVLSSLGQLAGKTWLRLPEWFAVVYLDSYVIMPNHMHGVLVLLQDNGACLADPGQMRAKHGFAPTVNSNTPCGTKSLSLSSIIQAYKSCVAREWHRCSDSKQSVWQRGFYDHVIRDEQGLQRIREYIMNNPAQWCLDRENAARTGICAFYAWLDQHCSKPR